MFDLPDNGPDPLGLELPSPIPDVESVRLSVTGPIDQREADAERQVKGLIAEWRTRPEGMPDGLIVSDDIMMRGVALALLSSGVKVPEKMTVVSQATDRVRL